MNPKLEDEWSEFKTWQDSPEVDEAMKASLLHLIRGMAPGAAIGVVQDAYNRMLINRATFLAVLDDPRTTSAQPQKE